MEAVIGHELSHVKNGDMVTMTLLQGVVNTFVFFFARVIGWVVDRQILRNEDDAPGAGYYITALVLDICLGFLLWLTSLVGGNTMLTLEQLRSWVARSRWLML